MGAPLAERHDLAILVEGELAPHIVLRELARRLETVKVPAICRVLPVLPLTLNGKNERKQLGRFLEPGADAACLPVMPGGDA
ncbi:hypothetical protein ABZ897_49790 [Nonomuraea sp. NPDC046802]|uniref:hypothetical protein n=1 Tax=Nonomuraea sp. NPDC046802 TaxID=3154919 RepID=UPI0033F9E756